MSSRPDRSHPRRSQRRLEASGRTSSLTAILVLTSLGALAKLAHAQEPTITVDFSSPLGAPTYAASGFLYGLSADATQPDLHFVADIKTRLLRVGGSRLDCPNGGWVNGGYDVRWKSVLAYYGVARAVGARLVLLVSDLWGSDLACSVGEFPGDNGDWSRYSSFLTQIISDVEASGMTGPDLIWDLWNEPDCCGFWGDRAQGQYLEMWTRGYQQVRAALPGAVISGPSSAGSPSSTWFVAFLDSIAVSGAVPDYLSWHLNPGDPVESCRAADESLAARGLTVLGYQINEYGLANAQGAGPSGWYIGRLERAGIDAAARSNWGGGIFACPNGVCTANSGLWDTMAGVVQRGASGYEPLPAWWMHERYAEMTGVRIATSSTSNAFEAVAATDESKRSALVVLGARGTTNTVTVNLTHLDSAPYLVSQGRVGLLLERFPDNGEPLDGPTVEVDLAYDVVDNTATIAVARENTTDGYVLKVTIPRETAERDAGSDPDQAEDTAHQTPSDEGCGCHAVSGARSAGVRSALALLAAMALVPAFRRRRQRREHWLSPGCLDSRRSVRYSGPGEQA